MKKAKPSKGRSASKRLTSKKSITAKNNPPAGRAKKTVSGKKNILPTMSVFEAVNRFPKTAEVFYKHGLHCFGCSVARYENIAQAARVHGISEKKLLDDLNKATK